MPLLAYDGALRLGSCCARPVNRVRKPEIADIVAWLERHPEAREALRDALAAPQGPA